ncbi:MAG: DUF4178 domain-containing protein [Candidatus Accumulibacter sp.]|jgi:hypothetical protein|nr:DUF4178 domain-containing protein [Accumulibacter sp.]
MPRIAQCPSCGAPVTFHSAVSVLAVCQYCRTTLVDRDGEIENLGKMAALADDRSPLRLGAEGLWKKTRFTVIGRLQLKYEQGLWSEWFLLFDNQRTGWLSEAAGEYALFFPKLASVPLPAFAELVPGGAVKLEAKSAPWTVTNVERAECVSGEGELPFRVGSGYPAPVADLRAGARMATLDYSESEDKPLLFVGQTVDFASLKWANLRAGGPLSGGPKIGARALRCAKCGAPLELRHEDILAVGCARCGAVTDAETQKLLSALKAVRQVAPRIPLGAIGKLRGEKLEAIGFMQRHMISAGSHYAWREYLFVRVNKPGYRWLTEYDGHWNVVDVVGDVGKNRGDFDLTSGGKSPRGQSRKFGNVTKAMVYRDKVFRHFQSYTAWVDFVIGEFTWRVKTGEETRLMDYIAPPLMLSKEQTKNEISWSLSEYVEPNEIAKAFGLKAALPKPRGIYANQPSPWKTHGRPAWKIALSFFAAALVLQLALRAGFSPHEYMRENFRLDQGGEPRISSPFSIARPATLRVVSEARGIENSWVELGLWLVNEQNGEARAGTTELSYYSGRDSDGYWVENGQRKTLVFRDLPAGTWRLMVEQSRDPAAKTDKFPEVSLTVAKAPAPWDNLPVFVLALLLWPLFLLWRAFSFEIRRWEESDYSTGE